MPRPRTDGLSTMPPWATTPPFGPTSHTQFWRWLMTIRRPAPDFGGTGRRSQRGAASSYSRLRVAPSSLPVAGPAWQPRWSSRCCAFSTHGVPAASAGATASTSAAVATRAASRDRWRFIEPCRRSVDLHLAELVPVVLVDDLAYELRGRGQVGGPLLPGGLEALAVSVRCPGVAVTERL